MAAILQSRLETIGGIVQVTPATEAVVKRQFPQALQEWLERQAFTLSMQAFGMRAAPVHSGRLYALKHHVADVAKQLSADDEEAIHQLRSAPLEFKREVLRYMQIIPAAIAAAFLGLSEKNLTGWQQCWSIFGQSYAGAHCYSLKELQIIAENRGQIFTGLVADDVREVATVADTALDEVVMVEEEVAAAFVNMSREEIRTQLPRNALMRRPYRLSDLEKIRVAKLNAPSANADKERCLPPLEEPRYLVIENMPSVWPECMSYLAPIRVATLNGQQQ